MLQAVPEWVKEWRKKSKDWAGDAGVGDFFDIKLLKLNEKISNKTQTSDRPFYVMLKIAVKPNAKHISGLNEDFCPQNVLA